jgi:hypothetical protein
MWRNRATSCAAESDSRPWGADIFLHFRIPHRPALRFFFGPDTYRFDGTHKLGSALTARFAGRAWLLHVGGDVFGEKLENRAHGIAVVAITVEAGR